MKPIKLTLPPLDENCYILEDGEKNAIAIDPGSCPEMIEKELTSRGLTLSVILLTHGHFDHIGAAARLKEKYGAKVYINKNDECMLSDRAKSGAFLAPFFEYEDVSCDGYVGDGDIVRQGSLEIKVMETPGHSKGSVCYICGDTIFAGDTVFKGSVGRTDLYSGDRGEQEASLKKLTSLDGDYFIFCGHGEDTTLDRERTFNPYIMR
ncbi:MAG: MBL fold metallo-hydrolase [Bacteroides sp.]|nr:MBL fold metallo-hydrolase [Bacteroides sp.]